MAKHGRDRKRRSGRTGRTKLKNRSWKRYDPNPRISDPIIKKHWDASKSPAENLREMGLVATPNAPRPQQAPPTPSAGARRGSRSSSAAVSSSGSDGAAKKAPSCVIELYDVPESDTPLQRRHHPLEENDETYIARCLAKHGTDYSSMFRDIKTNQLQHTEAQLRRLGARYLLLTPEQRHVDVPDRVKPLLAFPS